MPSRRELALLVLIIPVREHITILIIRLSPPPPAAKTRGTDDRPPDAHLGPGVVVLVDYLRHGLPDPPPGLYNLRHQDVVLTRDNEAVESQASGKVLKDPIVVDPKVRVPWYPQLDPFILGPEPQKTQPTERRDADTGQDEVNWLPSNCLPILEEKSLQSCSDACFQFEQLGCVLSY